MVALPCLSSRGPIACVGGWYAYVSTWDGGGGAFHCGGHMTDGAFALWWPFGGDLADRVVLCVFLNCNCNWNRLEDLRC